MALYHIGFYINMINLMDIDHAFIIEKRGNDQKS